MNCCENILTQYGSLPEKAVVRAMKRVYLKIGRNLNNLSKINSEIISSAKKNIAKYAEDVFFVKSKEEANRLCINSLAQKLKHRGNHIVISQVEPKEILEICYSLENQGFIITKIPVARSGGIDLNILERSLTPNTIIVSVMHTNNETGVMQPMEKIVAMCRACGAVLHSDISVSFGRIPIKTKDIDAFCISSHTVCGPQNVAAAIIKHGFSVNNDEISFDNFADNLAAIAGFSKSVSLAFHGLSREYNRIYGLRAKMMAKLSQSFNGIYFNGDDTCCLPHIINFCVKGLEGRAQSIVEDVKNCTPAFSATANCVSPQGFSHVLKAMGLSEFEAGGAVRIELNRFATAKETDKIFNILGNNLKKNKMLFSLL